MTQARLPACSEFQIGRFRKGQRVGGCGKARCYLCHGEKLCKRPTPQQRRADISYKEWLHELVDLLRERRQVILYGPPGTGKTFLALAGVSPLVRG